MKRSAKAIAQMVLDIEDMFGNYKFVDVVQKDKGLNYTRNGFTIGALEVPVATLMLGYDYTHQKSAAVKPIEAIKKEVYDSFSGMCYSPERDLVVPAAAIMRKISICAQTPKVYTAIRKSTVRYNDTVDVIVASTDDKCLAEISFRAAAMFKI